MSIVKPEDFTQGRYYIPKNFLQEEELQYYIDMVEREYLCKLLGVELHKLFIADIDGTTNIPVTDIYLKIFNEFCEQYDSSCFCKKGGGGFLQSEGIKRMIMGFVYFISLRDRITRVHTTGIKRTIGMNSENVNGFEHDLNSRYNQSVETYKAIQDYIYDVNKCVDYPTFKGINIRYNHNI